MLTTVFILALSLTPGSEPGPRDVQALSACIAASKNPQSCVGAVSGPCMEFEDSGDTTSGMIACTQRELVLWDQRLNTAYADLRTRLLNSDQDQRRRDAVRAAQRAWISYRDAECDQLAMQFLGGTLSGVIAVACLNDMTAERALDLEAQAAEASL